MEEDHLARVRSRRLFLRSGLAAVCLRTSKASTPQDVYHFITDRCDIQVSVEFHDRYSSRGFWLNNHSRNEPFCLSLQGEEDRNCRGSFAGSVAIARYNIRSHPKQRPVSFLREHVRDIDRGEGLDPRPPFHRKVELHRGVASDVQAFGYKDSEPAAQTEPGAPWYYFRQDLFLDADGAPCLILHWKHALNEIRMLDIIPGNGTSLVSSLPTP